MFLGEVDELKTVGVQAVLDIREFRDVVTQLTSSFDWHLCVLGFSPDSVDPRDSDNVIRSSGGLHLLEPHQEEPRRDWEQRIDAVLDELAATTNENRAQQLIRQAREIWLSQLVVVPLVTVRHAVISSLPMGNAVGRLDGLFLSLERVYLESE